ncbi:ThuA domain-containing protein [Paracoccus versutus]|nr:ThuA domain-containing protein [Paracoccus versutus]
MRPMRRVLLVVGGLYHDFDFVRLELLAHLARHEHLRVDLRHDYSDLEALTRCDALITYTAALLPDAAQTAALADWVERGGRWFALHGTNSAIRIRPDGKVLTPAMEPLLFDLLGSQFLAHPVPGRYRIRPVEAHPLTQGIEAFFLEDEHYLQRHADGNLVLMASEFQGQTALFQTRDWPKGQHQSFYLRPRGMGGVLYLTPGHARGRYDMQPLAETYPFVERGAWILPVFHRLIARGIAWLDRDLPETLP